MTRIKYILFDQRGTPLILVILGAVVVGLLLMIFVPIGKIGIMFLVLGVLCLLIFAYLQLGQGLGKRA